MEILRSMFSIHFCEGITSIKIHFSFSNILAQKAQKSNLIKSQGKNLSISWYQQCFAKYQ